MAESDVEPEVAGSGAEPEVAESDVEPGVADVEPDYDRDAELARDATLEPSAATVDTAPAGDAAADDPTMHDDTLRDEVLRDDVLPDDTLRDETLRDDTLSDDTVDTSAGDHTVDTYTGDEAGADDPLVAATMDAMPTDGSEVPAERAPGEIEGSPVADLWPADTADSLRDRWRELQLRFVDDPQGAATEADALVSEAVDALTASLAAQRAELAEWRTARDSDTEGLRVAVQRYHTFLDRVLGL